ncbi:hypothetical protein J2R78_001105 [Bradyrhizobium sp. USDA 4538]|nr:hypothetical protein [Bradyrhizobium sp. USDA 4538]MCP1898703.1 hypothetical protein [Bradyrhizobium sp. USDA 4537]MCP1987186.1 hypothetical protein [Bradyrhizobium sp. USDA 4539]
MLPAMERAMTTSGLVGRTVTETLGLWPRRLGENLAIWNMSQRSERSVPFPTLHAPPRSSVKSRLPNGEA